MPPKVLIEVCGGVVQRVTADRQVDVYLLDFDDLNQGALPEPAKEPYNVEIVKDMGKELDNLLRPYQERRPK